MGEGLHLVGLQHKLRMMGVPVVGPTSALCDNKAVVGNSSSPESQLKKKHLSIAYQYARECFAKLAARIAFEPAEASLAGLRAKALGWQRRLALRKKLLRWLAGSVMPYAPLVDQAWGVNQISHNPYPYSYPQCKIGL